MDKAQQGDNLLSNLNTANTNAESKATVLMVKESERSLCPSDVLVVADPYVAFAKVAQALDLTPAPAENGAASAVVAADT